MSIDKRALIKLTGAFLLISLLLSACWYVWQTSKQNQLERLSLNAGQHLNLYVSKVKEEFNQVYLSVLPILASTPVIVDFLSSTTLKDKEVNSYLNDILPGIAKRAIFVGNSEKFILSSAQFNIDFHRVEQHVDRMASRAFNQRNSHVILFQHGVSSPIFLLAIPVMKQGVNIGFVGALIELSEFQLNLTQAWLPDNQTLVISDQRGIIIMASNENWLYRTFSSLPYAVKEKLSASFMPSGAFEPLGMVSIENNLLTIRSQAPVISEQQYLVHSRFIDNYQLRIHHLSDVKPVLISSLLYVALTLGSFIVLAVCGLFLRERKQNQKIASMALMASKLTHEISQPITAIKTESAIAKKYLDKGELIQSKQSIQTIAEYTNMLTKVTGQLKDFAQKNKTGSQRYANVLEVLHYSKNLYQHRLQQEQISWQEISVQRELNAAIDPFQLQQVMANLIQNACDAMEGSVNKKITVRLKQSVNSIVIDVYDSGVGIKADVKGSLFEPFVSTKDKQGSMGLGLAICRDILIQANSTIEFIEQQKGTCFRVCLPVAKTITEEDS